MWNFRRRIAIFALAMSGSLMILPEGQAQAACYGPQQQLPAQTAADFISNPAQLLQQFPNGEAEIISRVRDLAASNPATLPLILNLVAGASSTQIDAIGTGLGQAALTCIRTDPAYATEIQQVVVALNNSALSFAFAAVLGDKPIGAAGGGAGGGGGGGGPTNPLFGALTGFGGSSTLPNTGTANTGTNYFTFSNFSASTPGGLTTSTTTITSVSPSR
jgi:hypothetical protein